MIQLNNQQQIFAYFDNDKICRDYLSKIRWPDDNIICPKCQQEGSYKYSDNRYRCRHSKCKFEFTVLSISNFKKNLLPLPKLLISIFVCFEKMGKINSCELGQIIGIRQATAYYFLKKITVPLQGEAFDQYLFRIFYK